MGNLIVLVVVWNSLQHPW